MEQKIRDWYIERCYHPHMMLSTGKMWGFTQVQIESAMIHCHHKIVNEGKLVHDIDVARYVRNVCRDVDTEVRSKELEVLYESKDRLDRYKAAVGATCIITAMIHVLLTLFYITLI